MKIVEGYAIREGRMPKVIDKREGNWRVLVGNTECPFVFYPRADVSCELLEKRGNTLDTYCCFENCSLKEV